MVFDFEARLQELKEKGELTFEKEKPLSTLCTFRIGGNAEYAVFPRSEEGFIEAYNAAREANLNPRVLGNGSNVLFPDEGCRGVLIFLSSMRGASFKNGILTAKAGESVTSLALKAQKKGLSGLEFYYGIPGSVGGAVYMNAGAYEHSTSEVLIKSRCFHPESGKVTELDAPAHDFGYRHSVYMTNGAIILTATYALKPGDPAAVKAQMDDYMRRRRDKQPLEFPSAGSVFKRCPGHYTGKLIEDAGLKGKRIGGAEVSTKHAGFIINVGGATAKDVKDLVSFIQERIFEVYGLRIERELIYFEKE